MALALGACATPPAPPPEIREGKIEQINSATIPNEQHLGVGAILGGVGGAAIGSLFGGGTGRDVAIAIGSIGGAIAGSQIQKHYDKPQPGQQVIVRLTSGVLVVVTQPVDPSLRVGQEVFVEGAGQGARVIPRQ